jgi:glutathione peroxidase
MRAPHFALVALFAAYPSGRAADRTVFDYSLVTLDGKDAPLSAYRDKVLLIAVVADKSQYSAQLGKLDELYKKQKDAGLAVVAVTTDEFGGEAIAAKKDFTKIYRDDLKLSFPVYGPVQTRGKTQIPLFDFLEKTKQEGVDGRVHWVFTKLLVNRSGKLVASFDSDVEPDSPEVIAAIEKTLANQDLQHKKEDEKDKKAAGSEPDDDDQ